MCYTHNQASKRQFFLYLFTGNCSHKQDFVKTNMSWNMVQSASTVMPTPSPNSRMSNIDRDYSYGGWSSGSNWKNSSKGNPNAALSALALIAFLFFLNLLQQQLSAGQQQTLLFMVNNTNTGRRRRDVGSDETYVSPLKNTNDDQYEDDATKERVSPPSMPRLKPPDPAPAPPTEDLHAVSAWMQGKLAVTELPPSLFKALTKCRTVVACTVHQTISHTSSILHHNTIKQVLSEISDVTEFDGLDEACGDLLATAKGECGTLAQTLTSLLPDFISQNNLKHDPHDLL